MPKEPGFYPSATVATNVRVDLIRRHRRQLCRECGRKRVLIAVGLGGDGPWLGDTTEFACLECWGVRESATAR